MADTAAGAAVGNNARDPAFHHDGARYRAAFFAGGAKAVLIGEAVTPLNDRDLGAGFDYRRFGHGRGGAWNEAAEEVASG